MAKAAATPHGPKRHADALNATEADLRILRRALTLACHDAWPGGDAAAARYIAVARAESKPEPRK